MKALRQTLIFLLFLLLLSWVPRLFFHAAVSTDAGVPEILSWNYLKVSVLFDLKTATYWFGLLFLLLAIRLWVSHRVLQRISYVSAFVLSALYLLFCAIAYLYYPIVKTIIGKDLFVLMGGQDMRILAGYVLDYWWAALAILLIAHLAALALTRQRFQLQSWQRPVYVLVLFVGWVLAARGSLGLKPLNHLNAYSSLPADRAMSAMSPAFVFLESLMQDGMERKAYFGPERMEEERIEDLLVIDGEGNWRPNICIILLESFGEEYTAQSGIQSFTPFLDSLMQEGVRFTEGFSNGLRSMDAVSSLFLGVPSLMNEPYLGSLYAHNSVSSLFQYLKPMGYNSSFYHGADRASMGFEPFLRSHGLDRYIGAQDYPRKGDHDGHWGIYDEPFLQYFAEQMAHQPEPWLSTVFTLSSHHPYSVPKAYSHLPDGGLEIHKAVRYTDLALKKFFDYASHQPWFDHTLFVITADHSSINQQARFRTISGRFRVPFFFYSSSWEAREIHKRAQHIDLLPSLLHALGFKGEVMSLGQDLFGEAERPLLHHANSLYALSDSSRVLVFDGETSLGLYDPTADPEQRNDLRNAEPRTTERMLDECKARVQNFTERVINNTYR